ncbi:glutaredoxin family protein [Microbacterium limosum]|uniref:Glutaredoxin family protein n=1 Tax=Microbacterium limosum TaxID=3079935 RepID=A0AAU0MHS4_9MICO|nr:glutaredoxin family protein [Microbacterium sp. Y20]WOQ70086.1 glutaredoxin family protein [Microbacterium sp. Y20]
MPTLTLIGKPDCHLCDVAEGVIERVLAELPDEAADRVQLVQSSILDDPALYAQWWEKIPVVLIDGDLHAHWRVAPDRLRDALLAADDRPKEATA